MTPEEKALIEAALELYDKGAYMQAKDTVVPGKSWTLLHQAQAAYRKSLEPKPRYDVVRCGTPDGNGIEWAVWECGEVSRYAAICRLQEDAERICRLLNESEGKC